MFCGSVFYTLGLGVKHTTTEHVTIIPDKIRNSIEHIMCVLVAFKCLYTGVVCLTSLCIFGHCVAIHLEYAVTCTYKGCHYCKINLSPDLF